MATQLHPSYSPAPALPALSNPQPQWSHAVSSGPGYGPQFPNSQGMYTNQANPWREFFGEAPRPMYPAPYHKENADLPEAYVGSNPYLSQVMIRTITEKEMFWVTHILPWTHNESNDQIVWDKIIFDDHMLNRRPEESTSRLLTYSREENSASYVSHGIAFIMESGFWKTAQGKMHYAKNIQQISNAVVTTASLGVATALLDSRPRNTTFEEMNDMALDHHEFMNLLQTEADNFMMVQKTENGFDLLYDNVVELLRARNVNPDTVIVPHGMMKFLKYGRPENLAVSGKVQHKDVIRSGGRYGKVFESTAFPTGHNFPNYDPFFQQRTIGNYFLMDYRDTEDVPANEFKTSMRDIFAWSESADDFKRHSFKNAFMHSGIVTDKQGTLGEVGSFFLQEFRTWGEYLEHYNVKSRINQSGSAKGRLVTAVQEALEIDTGLQVEASAGIDPSDDFFTQIVNKGSVAQKALLGPAAKLLDDILAKRKNGQPVDEREYVATELAKLVNLEGGDESARASAMMAGLANHDQVGFIRAKFEKRRTDKVYLVTLESQFKWEFTYENDRHELAVADAQTAEILKGDAMGAFGYVALLVSEEEVEEKENGRWQSFDAGTTSVGVRFNVAFSEDTLRRHSKAVSERGAPKVDEEFLQELVERARKMKNWFMASKSFWRQYGHVIFSAFASYLYNATNKDEAEKNFKVWVVTMATIYKEHLFADGSKKAKGRPRVPDDNKARLFAAFMRRCMTQAPTENDESKFPDESNFSDEDLASPAALSHKVDGVAASIAANVLSHSGLPESVNELKTGPARGKLTVDNVWERLKRYTIVSGALLLKMMEYDLPVPVSLELCAPHIRFRCGSMVVCKSGRELGATYYGFQDMQLSRDTSQKMIHGHYTQKLKAVVQDSDKVQVVRDSYVVRYDGGGGHAYWSCTPEDHDLYQNSGDNCCDRDLFVLAHPADHKYQDPVHDITGNFDPTVYGGPANRLHYPMAQVYAQRWGWYHGTDPLNRNFVPTQPPRFNTIVWQGAQRNFRYTGNSRGSWDRWVTCKGHLGDRIYPGCAKVRRGREMHLLPVNYNNTAAVSTIV